MIPTLETRVAYHPNSLATGKFDDLQRMLAQIGVHFSWKRKRFSDYFLDHFWLQQALVQSQLLLTNRNLLVGEISLNGTYLCWDISLSVTSFHSIEVKRIAGAIHFFLVSSAG